MKEMSLDEIKSCSLDVLDFLDRVCHDYSLTYYLCGGTLLGAVRHQGFIPWDDDIDIMMPRKDYERLFEVWPPNEEYAIRNYKNTHNLPIAYGKAIDLRTIKIEPIRTLEQLMGVDVDIFPIDGLPSDIDEAKDYYREIEKAQKRIDIHSSTYGKGSSLPRTIARNARILFLRICELLGIYSLDKATKDFDSLAQRYSMKDSEFCGITAISHYGIKEMNPKKNYVAVEYVTFEGKNYPAPNGYTDYLSRLYGQDYMELPPIEKRNTHHHYKAYWK